MTKWRLKSKKRPTGGRVSRNSKKKRLQRGREFSEPKIGERNTRAVKRRGNLKSVILMIEDVANVTDPKTKKTSKSKILSVTQNHANQHYTRRNVMTKGAIVKTELGEAKITSTPSRHGIVNAVLLESKA